MYREKMSNLTEIVKNFHDVNKLDSKMLEKTRRYMVMLKNTYDMNTVSLVSGNVDLHSLTFSNNENTTSKDVSEKNNYDNASYKDAITTKQLIDLAFSAFGMQFHDIASNLLQEAVMRL